MCRSLSEAANYVFDQFKHFEVTIPKQSRINATYHSVCNNDGSSRGLIPEDDPNFSISLEALRDFRQLEFFFDQIRNIERKADYVSILNRIVSDSDSIQPQDDEQNSPSRDAQAEAFAFSVCMNAGMTPIFTEPDIICHVMGKTFGVAVKRIKNLSKLKTRLVKAAKQIHKKGLPGIIFVDVTRAVNPANDSIYTNQSEINLGRWWKDKMRRTTNESLDNVQNEEVRGIILHEHCPTRFSNGQYLLRSMNYGIQTAKNIEEQEEWRKFKNTFEKGLPNLIPLT
jgi:hypothetical protein